MNVILLKEVEGLGNRGKVVSVADGYGRNFLIPKGLAFPDSLPNRKRFEEEERVKRGRTQKEKREAEKIAEELNKLSLTTVVQVGEGDRLFGSVTAEDIAILLEKEGISVDRRKILLRDPIHELGVFSIPIRLHSEVEGVVKLWVVRE